jgi:hypothetical protein
MKAYLANNVLGDVRLGDNLRDARDWRITCTAAEAGLGRSCIIACVISGQCSARSTQYWAEVRCLCD